MSDKPDRLLRQFFTDRGYGGVEAFAAATNLLVALELGEWRVVPAGHIVIDPADLPTNLVEILSTVTLRGDDADDPAAYAALRTAARLLTPEAP